MFCLKNRKKYRKQKPKRCKDKKGKIMLSWKCAVWDSEKLRFIKNEEASGLLSNSEIKALLSKIPILYDISFIIIG